MSNQAVGGVYQTIIEEVVNSSRVDFEENGVEESVLEELRLGWQQKLSQLDVARFPWDPKPDPPAPAAAPPAVAQQPPPAAHPPPVAPHSQAHFSPQLPMPNAGPPGGLQNGIKTEPQAYHHPQQQPNFPGIKQEPGTQPGNGVNAGVPGYPPADGGNVAQQRALQQIQGQYGQHVAAAIQLQPQTGQKPPPPAHNTPARTQEEYRQQMAASTAAQQQQHSSLGNGQTDGAADEEADEEEDEEDFEGVLMRRGAAGELQELGRVEIDNLLHRHIAERAKAMEGGGLMVPLKEATRHRTAGGSSRARGVAAHDGGDDEEEVDEDAINSDLDDPEEDEGDPEADDEGLGHIMLCMYDKVQRVKNKWKCTLKDGVLTVNGKEYVFHKATGEYEW